MTGRIEALGSFSIRVFLTAMVHAKKRGQPIGLVDIEVALESIGPTSSGADTSVFPPAGQVLEEALPLSSQSRRLIDYLTDRSLGGNAPASINTFKTGIKLLRSRPKAEASSQIREAITHTLSLEKEIEERTRAWASTGTLQLYIDPGEATASQLQEVLDSLSGLHEALGGLGLTFKFDGQYVRAAVPAVQPVVS